MVAYWATDAMKGTVESGNGGSVTTLASRQLHPAGVAIDGQYVYWTDNAADQVMRAPLGGGNADTLASNQGGPRQIAVDANAIYWTSASGTVMKLAK
jgi:hypothetical protein